MVYCGSLFQIQAFFLCFFFLLSLQMSQRARKSCSTLLLKCLFLSIHGWGCFVWCHQPWYRECVEIPKAWQLEVKRVATAVKAGCLLMSRPAEWMRTQMGFLSGGLFFWPSLPMVGDMGTSARIDWHLIEWGKTQSFNSEWDVVDGQEGMCVGGILEVFAQDEVTIFFFKSPSRRQ